jgi:hypothetical protein
VPTAHAQVPDDEPDPSAPRVSSFRSRPVGLADIDHLLEASSGVATSRGATPVRAWRDDLALVLDALRYARAILAADVGILRHALAAGGSSEKTVIDELPKVLGARSWGDGWSEPSDPEATSEIDPDVFVRAGELVAAHQEMAAVETSSPEEVARVLGHLEDRLVEITARQDAVELRLREIREAIVRQYREGVVPTRTWPG